MNSFEFASSIESENGNREYIKETTIQKNGKEPIATTEFSIDLTSKHINEERKKKPTNTHTRLQRLEVFPRRGP